METGLADDPRIEVDETQLARSRCNPRRAAEAQTAQAAVISQGSVSHGIYANAFVLAGGESAYIWRNFRSDMSASLAPIGAVEVLLADRITLTAWRLRRILRFEAETIRQGAEDDERQFFEQLRRELKEDSDKTDDELIHLAFDDAAEKATVKRAFAKLRSGAETNTLTDNEAVGILSVAFQISSRAKWPDEHWPPAQPGFTGWTIGLVRKSAEYLQAARSFRDVNQLLQAVGKQIRENAQKATNRANGIEAARNRIRCRNLLPDQKTAQRIARYESHLSRQFYRDLHELQRLQAARQGLQAVTPIAIDVDATDTDTTEAASPPRE